MSDQEMSPAEREHINIAKQRSIEDIHNKECGRNRADFRGPYQGASSSRYTQHGNMQFFKNSENKFKRKSGLFGKKNQSLNIEEMDPSTYRNRECTQQKLSNMWTNNSSFKTAKHAIGKWFIYSSIPPNAATNPYYQAAIDEIARAGAGVKVVFHKSINASSRDKDANYIYELMDDVVEEIGEQYVVQVITDNGSAYKKDGELLMRKRKHLYWTPCAAHCIDLMLEDFTNKTTVKVVVEQAKRISNFIYNHNKVLDIMRKYTNGKELLRPGATHFATNYIALESIVEQKLNLQRMLTSEDWSKNAASRDPSGKKIQDVILDSSFWKSANNVCNLHAPASGVLRMMDGEKQATMGYVYEGMRLSKLAIEKALPRSHKKYCDIIEKRLKNQMIHGIHLVAYYLNPAYQYELELSHKQELLDALKRVIQKLEPDPNIVASALSDGKYFREAMYCFADATTIRVRQKTEPASSSGCERNWSTFALIHTKVRNRLNYQKLERVVYAHYNMRLKLRHLMKDKRKVDRDFQPIDLSNIFDEDDVMSEWLDDPGDSLLDELDGDGQPPRPNTFLTTWVERLDGPSTSDAMPDKRSADISSTMELSDEDYESNLSRRERNGKRVQDDDEDEDKEIVATADDIVQDRDGCDDTFGVEKSQSSPEQLGLIFTEEQFFDYATQDEESWQS